MIEATTQFTVDPVHFDSNKDSHYIIGISIDFKKEKGTTNMEQTSEPTVSFSLTVKDASSALKFYLEAFGAVELFRLPTPEGGVAHAEFMIGNSRIYISDESAEWHAFAMPEEATASCLFSIMTADCKKSCDRALKSGAKLLTACQDYFWGTRTAVIKDPFGYRWAFNQKIEDVSPEEIARRAQDFFSS